MELIARPDTDPALAPLLGEAGIRVLGRDEIPLLTLAELDRAAPAAPVALKSGLWPGISRGPAVKGRGDETASASREPWVDANGFWIAYLRPLYPRRAAMVAPQPPADRIVPFDSVELALIEARVHGGNCILTFETRYREALVRKDARALAALADLRRTAAWLDRNEKLFQQPAFPTVTALVEPGLPTAEIANLLFRRNASPALAPAADPPPPDPARILALVAANLRPPAPALRDRILAHAAAGATVVTTSFSGPQPDRRETDRDFYKLGKGRIVAYRRTISDPSEFALDVIDAVTHARRAVRLWNAPAVIARGGVAPGGGALLHAINYGSPIDIEFPARIQGRFSRAEWLRPDAPTLNLPTAQRGTTTEVAIPALKRVGFVYFRS